jgi:NadR type nicotinamide-nucleotide adenylyltransferase
MRAAPAVLRVAILGAESTGKSTLAAALAARYRTVWVPEYLREFVEQRQRVPHADEQFHIASTQVGREDLASGGARVSRFLFCDTTPLMTAIYSGFYFDGADPQLSALVLGHRYDVTLVTAPDGPWEADGLQRESDAVRQAVHAQLLSELAARAVPYHLVSGTLEQRLRQVAAVLG